MGKTKLLTETLVGIELLHNSSTYGIDGLWEILKILATSSPKTFCICVTFLLTIAILTNPLQNKE